MKTKNVLLLWALLVVQLAQSQTDSLSPKATRKAEPRKDTIQVAAPVALQTDSRSLSSYRIKARFNPNDKIVEGTVDLTWSNYSADTLREVQFHLYLNAFKNSKSTFLFESRNGNTVRGFGDDYPKSWGYVDIISLKRKEGAVLTDKIKFISPDDGNADDQTVASVALDTPLLPGQKLELKIVFESKLPSVVARTGFVDNFYMVAQWFPKLGVYEPIGWRNAQKGGWNTHQFHANSEFYANFSDYEVELTTPTEYIVGATGQQIGSPKENSGMKTYLFRAKDVVDFAWTASPQYVVVEDQWEHVKLTLLTQKDHMGQAKRYIESAKATLAYFKENLGLYPYSTLTLVDPPTKAQAAGGMEYPTLVTLGTNTGMPDAMRLPELVTVHEIGHQFFMGILASNEFEEPWLDEGFNTYWEHRIMDATYGAKKSVLDYWGLQIGDQDLARFGYISMSNPKIAENYRSSWHFTEGGYSTLTYQKTATWLHTLHGLVGDSAMNEIWKTYYQRWQYKHPSARSFIDVVNEVTAKHHGQKLGRDMEWFFDQFLYGSNVCDYAVAHITNGKPEPAVGYFDRNGKREEVSYVAGQQKFETYYSKVVLHRLGEVVVPMELLVQFEDGTQERVQWDGRSRSKTIWFTNKTSPVEWAMLDPDRKITMDVNRLNNSIDLKPNRLATWKYLFKFSFWLQNFLELFALVA